MCLFADNESGECKSKDFPLCAKHQSQIDSLRKEYPVREGDLQTMNMIMRQLLGIHKEFQKFCILKNQPEMSFLTLKKRRKAKLCACAEDRRNRLLRSVVEFLHLVDCDSLKLKQVHKLLTFAKKLRRCKFLASNLPVKIVRNYRVKE